MSAVVLKPSCRLLASSKHDRRPRRPLGLGGRLPAALASRAWWRQSTASGTRPGGLACDLAVPARDRRRGGHVLLRPSDGRGGGARDVDGRASRTRTVAVTRDGLVRGTANMYVNAGPGPRSPAGTSWSRPRPRPRRRARTARGPAGVGARGGLPRRAVQRRRRLERARSACTSRWASDHRDRARGIHPPDRGLRRAPRDVPPAHWPNMTSAVSPNLHGSRLSGTPIAAAHLRLT